MLRRSPSLRVLVVDDDPVLIDLIPWLLSVLGHTVETATTGELALLRLAAPLALDAALIDLRMPGMDGASLAAEIAALPHPPRLIGMSGGDPTTEQASRFNAFLHKPFTIEGLAQTLSDATLQPAATPPAAATEPVILDTAIYQRLAAAMPPAKLHQLYNRTLDYIRRTSPALDNASTAARSDLAHSLHGSCAMVGAMELATLTAAIERATHAALKNSPGSHLESPLSYKILRAAERLERILKSLQAI